MLRIYSRIAIILTILWCTACSVHTVTQKEYELLAVKNSDMDSTIIRSYQPYKDSLDKIMLVPIGTLSDDCYKQQPNSCLSNLMADILYLETQKASSLSVDCAIMNYGGIRVQSLTKGTIKIIDAYNIMPFDNYMGIIYLKGFELQQLCDSIAQKGGWPISNLSFTMNNGAKQIQINKTPLVATKEYAVAIIDYIANGGDNMDFLKDKKFINTGVLLRDGIIQYFKEKDQVLTNNSKRIEP